MPDITMCVASQCPADLRDTCYRFRAKPNDHYQSYSDFSIRYFDKEHCPTDQSSFLPIGGRRVLEVSAALNHRWVRAL